MHTDRFSDIVGEKAIIPSAALL